VLAFGGARVYSFGASVGECLQSFCVLALECASMNTSGR
jgi:hypothetical protein